MKVTYCTNAWGSVMAHCQAANNVNYAYYLATGDDETAIRQIAEAGYESVEMFDGNLLKYEDEPEQLRDILQKYEVSLEGVYSAGNFIYDDIIEEEYDKIMRTAVIAKKLGAKHLILGGGAIRYEGIREADYRKLGKALDEIARRAAENGLTASFHPHMGSMVESPQQLERIMAYSDIFLCPDCGHIRLGGGDPYDITRKYIDRIKYFHLKNVTKEGVFSVLDHGMIDFAPILDFLKTYREKIILAVECDADSPQPLEDAKATADYLRKAGIV